MVCACLPVEHSPCAGSLFLIARSFLHTPFGNLGALLCPARSDGQAVPVSHLCQLAYSTSLHKIRDGIRATASEFMKTLIGQLLFFDSTQKMIIFYMPHIYHRFNATLLSMLMIKLGPPQCEHKQKLLPTLLDLS